MAQVTFTIAAIDKTRAAFASIRQGLRNITGTTDASQKRMLTFGTQMLGLGSAVALVGGSMRRLATDVENVPGLNPEVVDSMHQLHAAALTARGVLDNLVATVSHGYVNLYQVLRYKLIEAFKGTAAAEADANERLQENAELIKQATGYYDRQAEAADRLIKARRDLANVGESAGASITRRRQESDLMESKALALTDEIKRTTELAKAIELRTDAERDMHKLVAENAKLMEESGVAIRNMGGRMVPLKDRIAGLKDEWRKLSEEMLKGQVVNDPASVENFNRLLKRRIDIAGELTKAYDEQNRIAADAANAIAGSFEDAAFSGENLRGVVNSLAKDLLRLVFRDVITNPLAKTLTGGIKSILGLASGGPVSAGTPYIVGENGPELFTPSSAGRIIPNHHLSGGGGGGDTYVIDARGADRSGMAELAAAIREVNGSIEERSVAAVFSRMKRGPSGLAFG